MDGIQHNETNSLLDFLASKADDPSIFSTPQAASYLSYLTSLPLPSLLAEPQALIDETNTLTSQLTTLCNQEYSTFLSLHQSCSTLSDTLDSFASSLDSLLDAIPALESETRTFSESTKVIQSSRKKATLVLEQHDKLLDILQIPQLIDTCVRNGYYSEAMDLSAQSTALLKRFPTIPVIIDVASESERAIRLMSTQLLAMLREPAKLPALFKAVNFLRKMRSLDEDELAVTFLSSRAVYLEQIFQTIETQRSDHARFMRKYVDVFRENVYDVITQYTSIFLDNIPNDSDLYMDLAHLLQKFAHLQIIQLVNVLKEIVPQIEDPISLTSLLTQLTYCSTSFARVGMDFRCLIERPFTNVVLSTTKASLMSASKNFISRLETNKGRPLTKWLITASQSTLISQPTPFLPATPIYAPPSILSSYPPMALYTNAVLSSFNSLRLLAPVSIYPIVYDILNTSLVEIGKAILSLTQSLKAKSKEDEASTLQILRKVVEVYLQCVVPFLQRGLREGVYNIKAEREEPKDLLALQEEMKAFLSAEHI
ncbi:hypothetical protein Clacol_007725 [Clathrus columnatus]|uniref:Conserved oligomeric Golgi complex subunit 8 n=1 Tax=Clathrus columnatus TaxID=1419009 RepID=A0AAV5AFQ1_9AGAM|nr:hypothetical protein Clacol_007725 [Clathrus columnatus]